MPAFMNAILRFSINIAHLSNRQYKIPIENVFSHVIENVQIMDSLLVETQVELINLSMRKMTIAIHVSEISEKLDEDL